MEKKLTPQVRHKKEKRKDKREKGRIEKKNL
jgi:hypothetical protein